MKKSETDNWFERVWEYREEVIYPKLFGKVERGIFTLTVDFFDEYFKQETIDPRWLHYGVLEYAPSPKRSSWLYVTSAMSNAWEDQKPNKNGPSGFGSEFVFETTMQSEWAIYRLLHLMAFQILLRHGRFPGRDSLELYHRIPLRTSITPGTSSIRWLILLPPQTYPSRFQLESGWVDLFAVVGITPSEAAFARKHDGKNDNAILKLLQKHGAFPVTDPTRKCIIRSGNK